MRSGTNSPSPSTGAGRVLPLTTGPLSLCKGRGQLTRLFSFGGGVQSTAALVLAAQGRIDYSLFVFANVGDDSEDPATLRYISTTAWPFAKKHNLELHEIAKGGRTLMQQIEQGPDIPIPAWPMKFPRSCTTNWKIRPLIRYAKKVGANVMGLGISTDEFMRAKDSRDPAIRYEFPLIELGLSRRDCLEVIASAGLPEPPRSACFFCPYNSQARWQSLKRDRPHLFATAVHIEELLTAKSKARGYGRATLRASGVPLEVMGDQATFGDLIDGECDSGYCWT